MGKLHSAKGGIANMAKAARPAITVAAMLANCMNVFILIMLLPTGIAPARSVFNSRTGTIDFNTAGIERARFWSNGNSGIGAAGREAQGGGC